MRDRFVRLRERNIAFEEFTGRLWVRVAARPGTALTLLDIRADGCTRIGAPTDSVRARSHAVGRAHPHGTWRCRGPASFLPAHCRRRLCRVRSRRGLARFGRNGCAVRPSEIAGGPGAASDRAGLLGACAAEIWAFDPVPLRRGRVSTPTSLRSGLATDTPASGYLVRALSSLARDSHSDSGWV